MYLAWFDKSAPINSGVVGYETLEKGYARFHGDKACPPIDKIVIGKEFAIGNIMYVFLEDDFLAGAWVQDHKAEAYKN